ncbi:MAG: erythrose-4-phosphate dehydrogenase [Oceanicoccus sp.]|uniref:type I glyceraldehyde-3-phosphate dehydrogenase n=1 Tax=Oceanicoccus sp. TaxID=2691044 RepID=UPI0026287D76|nr:glyceraldehyde 3-phosphate dehydrogenase NAD-binding domain-containing protein [Oceanicoccus sp.]MCP3908920.1 erythrose-4-phosphate dehydrogenase [Oceanicoccus sp.]MDG1772728.1 glyceraldehyde 3-phosphate dehydrogenase NAD-binding domain-containing protein [Oceanicoccus sp.]
MTEAGAAIRIAINGYGRIGRCVLRALYESGHHPAMQVVAINEPADLATIAHLTKYDSTHGRFPASVETDGSNLLVNGDVIAVSHHDDLAAIDWSAAKPDLVLECTGHFALEQELKTHLAAGANKVLLSQPGMAPIKPIVMGLNQQSITPQEQILSAASCTSNCITPVIDVLNRALTIESGVITTIHSAMNDQPVIDAYHHTDLRKTRAAGQSIIPVDTGLAAGIGRILPEMEGKFEARALRVPTINVSAMELSIVVADAASVETVNNALRQAAQSDLIGILGYSDEPLASCDYNHDARSCIVDAGQTRVSGNMINVLVWFDNEWAYANRMLDIAAQWLQQ